MMTMNDIMDDIMSRQTISPEEGDYYIYDILYCGKCNTPKMKKITVFGRKMYPYCLCRCEAERREKEEEERKRQEAMEEIRRMRRTAFQDTVMYDWTFANDDKQNPQISKVCQNYVDHFSTMKEKGRGLLLYGSVGTGKTYMSACIANELIDRGHPCLVTSFSRLVNTIQGMYDGKQDYIDGLSRFDLLVIDDLASERDTEYMGEVIQNIVDARYRSGLPMIVTTNLTKDDLIHPEDLRKQRIYSRLFEMCVPVEVKGKDRRKMILINEHEDMKELLGL